jgi:hypothetical protein
MSRHALIALLLVASSAASAGILTKDPLESIGNTRSIELVMKSGKVLTRQ